ncbi:MAG: hypothetical protein M3033_05780, partial [Acidobacteriota bacterium]|nr:hypothetical protein [Acidobacteriota bacterium]
LKALRAKTKNALERFEDAYPQFLEKYIKENSESSNANVPLKPVQIEGEISSAPEIRPLLKKDNNINKSDELTNKNSKSELINEQQTSLLNLEVWLKKSGKSEMPSIEAQKAVLPQILTSLDNINNKNIHTALNKAGFIRSGNEFVMGGGTQV